jgi:3-dehydroquinate dehydratase type II
MTSAKQKYIDKHIILIGFKHAGKSEIGKKLALKLKRKFIDLDTQIENLYKKSYHTKLTCRQIMKKHSENFFRYLEKITLRELFQKLNLAKNTAKNKSVIALGGGTPIDVDNQEIIKSDLIIHITTSQELLFSRILSNGIPAFIADKDNPVDTLKKLWAKREKIYHKLATLSIDNSGTLESTLENVLNKLSLLNKPQKQLLLLNGPNLNQLGLRDPAHYGNLTLKNIEELTAQEVEKHGFTLISYQSNHEGNLIDILQTQSSNIMGIIINPGALTHYSYALYDALIDTKLPIVEVHLSKISQREDWRRHSVTAPACIKTFEGKQSKSYLEAINYLIGYIKKHKIKQTIDIKKNKKNIIGPSL